MENSTAVAQIKALLDQAATEAHATGYTAGRAFEAERVRLEANRLADEQEALPPDQRLKSVKAVLDELLRRLAVGVANFPVPEAAREGFESVAPTPEPEPAKPLTTAKEEQRAAAKAAKR